MEDKIRLGNCVEKMKDINDNYIDLTITSPPYDNLREYNGFSFDFEKIAKELFRITKDGGIVVWVVGDATIKGSETGTSFKQALFFMECGFRLHDTMIYKKNNYMPLNHNRYDPCFEYMFVLSKGKPNTFNPLKIPCKTAGAKYNYATRSSASSKDVNSALRSRDKVMVTNSEKYRGNIWGYDVGKHKGSKDDIWNHPATFPEKLAEDHILSWSNEGDLVFDPMCGSGTTLKMAMINNRDYLGIEISEEYKNIAIKRLNSHKETETTKNKMKTKEEDKLKEINELLTNNKHWGNCSYENFGIDEEVCGCKDFMTEEKKRLEKKLNSPKETNMQ